jgi:hypothetical protein
MTLYYLINIILKLINFKYPLSIFIINLLILTFIIPLLLLITSLLIINNL